MVNFIHYFAYCVLLTLIIAFCVFQLNGFGIMLLEGIDPNPENFVCAGIVHTSTLQVGCLLRLEPNRQAQVYIFELLLLVDYNV